MTNEQLKGTMWRHKKRGSVYVVLDVALLQTQYDENCLYCNSTLKDDSEIVVYADKKGTYVREKSEFLDGRFEQVKDQH